MTQSHVARGTGAGHAVVIGASMAGLLAARVLAGHVDRVTVVERDRLPDAPEPRRSVPQGRQVHVLLARGSAVLDRLFPGFTRELVAAGAVPFRIPGDALMLSKAGWVDRRAPGWTLTSAGRPLIEATVRRRLLQLPGVTVVDGSEVTALGASDDGRIVSGVALRRVDGEHAPFTAADLVVDASARGSRTPHWLADLGYPRWSGRRSTHTSPTPAGSIASPTGSLRTGGPSWSRPRRPGIPDPATCCRSRAGAGSSG
jgi:2-polyprenyl-6-methoxyphenol hydroxylase-like FAD-dependent oxidoreductase